MIYDNASRLWSMILSNTTAQISRFDYALNAVGNRTVKTETVSPADIERCVVIE